MDVDVRDRARGDGRVAADDPAAHRRVCRGGGAAGRRLEYRYPGPDDLRRLGGDRDRLRVLGAARAGADSRADRGRRDRRGGLDAGASARPRPTGCERDHHHAAPELRGRVLARLLGLGPVVAGQRQQRRDPVEPSAADSSDAPDLQHRLNSGRPRLLRRAGDRNRACGYSTTTRFTATGSHCGGRDLGWRGIPAWARAETCSRPWCCRGWWPASAE